MPPTSGAVASPPAHAVTFPDALILASAIFFVVAQFSNASGPFLAIAAALAAAAAILDWSRLARIAKVFLVLAGICFIVGSLYLAPERAVLLQRGLYQGVGFSCFLSCLGMLRYAVSRSVTIREATSYLMSVSDRRRYQAVKVGSHALGLLFNIGVVSLIGQMIASATQEDATQVRRKAILLASMRGTVLMTIWSPLGVGFAIITQSIPTLSPATFVLVAFAVSALLMVMTTVLHTELGISQQKSDRSVEKPPTDIIDPVRDGRSVRPLLLVLLACTLLFATTMTLHFLLKITPLAATIIVLPPFTLAWVNAESRNPASRIFDDARGMTASMAGMRTESTIFLSASILGAAAIVLLDSSGLDLAMLGDIPPQILATGCILLIGGSALLFIPHSIAVIFLAQLLGTSPFGHNQPIVLALSLGLGWAVGIALSPISAMSITMARLAAVSPATITLRWNGAFSLTLILGSVVVVSAAGIWS